MHLHSQKLWVDPKDAVDQSGYGLIGCWPRNHFQFVGEDPVRPSGSAGLAIFEQGFCGHLPLLR